MPTPRAPGQPGSPDPSLKGSIRNIVKDAHKWGGNGVEPDWDKIKRVLVTKHPDVIAKAFGGSGDTAASWIFDNWAALHGRMYQCKDGSKKHTCWRNSGKKKLDEDDANPAVTLSEDALDKLITEDDITHEMFFADSTNTVEEDGLVWKDILVTGKWKIHPNAENAARGDVFKITKEDLEEIVANFDEGAWEHVTVPKTHDDQLEDNTGFVKKLMVKTHPQKRGHYRIRAGIKFTDDLIKQKVLSGSIANVSCGLDFSGVRRNADGKVFGKVIKHLALTNQPWIKGLQPFGSPDQIAASEEDQDWTGSMILDEESNVLSEGSNKVDEVLNKIKELFKKYKGGDENALSELDGLEIPEGLTAEQAAEHLAPLASLAPEGTAPEESHGETPPSGGDPETEVSDNPKSTEGGDNMANEDEENPGGKNEENPTPNSVETAPNSPPVSVGLSEEQVQAKIDAAREQDRIELDRLRRENHVRRVREDILELEREGHIPAVLKEAKKIMLADEASTNLITLSEDDKEVNLTASDIVTRILKAIPSDTLLKFSEDTKRFEKSDDSNNINDAIDAELEKLRS